MPDSELARLEALLRIAPLPMAAVRPDGYVLFANDHAFTLFGLRREDNPQQTTVEFFSDPADHERLIAERLAGITDSRELQMKRADGTPIRVLVSSEMVVAGGEQLVISGMQDITGLRLAEEALRVSEQRFRALVENTGEIIYTVRAEGDPMSGDIDFVSSSVEDIIGYSPEEFLADPGLWSRIVHPDDMEEVWETTIALEQGGGNATRLYRLRHKATGEYRWMEDHVTFRPSKLPGAVTLLGAARDVTQRKQAEEESSLLQSVALAVSEAADLTSGLEAVLKIVCDATGWSVGEAWTPSRDGTALECAAWSVSNEALDGFIRNSEWMTFAPGVGLPGRVWSSGKPLWVRDVTGDPNCSRSA